MAYERPLKEQLQGNAFANPREATTGGKLVTGATGREVTEAPSEDVLIEMGLNALKEAYNLMSGRSRSTPGTRPPPTTEETQNMASRRMGRQAGEMGGKRNRFSHGIQAKMSPQMRRKTSGKPQNPFGMSTMVDRGRARPHVQRGSQSVRSPQPGAMMGQQQPMRQQMAFNPQFGMQPFNTLGAFGNLTRRG